MGERIYETRYFAATRAAVVRSIARRCGGRVLDARDPRPNLGDRRRSWRPWRSDLACVRVTGPREVHVEICRGLRALSVEWAAARQQQGRPRRYTVIRLDGAGRDPRVVVHSTWQTIDGQRRDAHGELRPAPLFDRGDPPASSPREAWDAAHRPPVQRCLSKKEARAARRREAPRA